jgi:hypothetical protein
LTSCASCGHIDAVNVTMFDFQVKQQHLMVSLPLHGKINAVNGDNIVAINNIFVLSDIHMGVVYTCMGIMF